MTCFCLVTLLCLLLHAPASARDIQISIAVDETAATTLQAREIAIQKSEKQAFWKLLDRVAPKRADELQAHMTPEQLHNLIKKFKVTNEKISAGRYRATTIYLFDSVKVNRLIYESEGLTSESGTGTLLVLAALNNNGTLQLWEPDNIWRKIFNEVALEKGRGKLIMPYGDPKDKMLLNQEILLSGDRTALRNIAARYGTRNVIIITASPRLIDQRMIMEVTLRRAGAIKNEATFRYAGSPRETVKGMMNRAARDIADKLGNTTNRYALFQAKNSKNIKTLVLRVAFSNARDWAEMREKITDLPSVQFSETKSISINYATLTLYYDGKASTIKRSLLARGVTVKEKNDYWQVSKP